MNKKGQVQIQQLRPTFTNLILRSEVLKFTAEMQTRPWIS